MSDSPSPRLRLAARLPFVGGLLVGALAVVGAGIVILAVVLVGGVMLTRGHGNADAPAQVEAKAAKEVFAVAAVNPLHGTNAQEIVIATDSSIRASAARPRWRSSSGQLRPSLSTTGASPIRPEKRVPSSVADIATSRRSGRSAAWASSANASPKSLSRLRSCTSSNSTAEMPASSGSAWMRLTKIPSVTTVTRVAAERLLSIRVA